jgi:hypothetical protein
MCKIMAIDLDSVDEDEAADICEDIDRLEGLLSLDQT